MDPKIHIADIVDIAGRAGSAIMEIYGTDFGHVTKNDRSPLTEADTRSHTIITENLRQKYPRVPILSEEGQSISWNERRKWDVFWLVDPLDGTKEFIKRNGEFTVNIALVENGAPTLGVVYAPAIDKMYWGDSKGSFRRHAGLTEKIRARERQEAGITAAQSRSHGSEDEQSLFDAIGVKETIRAGSSLKFCLVAEGRADLYVRLGNTMEWDSGAGHAVVTHAGGKVLLADGQQLVYGKENLKNEGFVAVSAGRLSDHVLSLIQ